MPRDCGGKCNLILKPQLIYSSNLMACGRQRWVCYISLLTWLKLQSHLGYWISWHCFYSRNNKLNAIDSQRLRWNGWLHHSVLEHFAWVPMIFKNQKGHKYSSWWQVLRCWGQKQRNQKLCCNFVYCSENDIEKIFFLNTILFFLNEILYNNRLLLSSI